MPAKFLAHLNKTLSEIETQGLMKQERPIVSPQRTQISVGERDVINLSANNYLGFADHPDLVRAARKGRDDKGFGMASVRSICGTQDIHGEMEQALARFLKRDDAILFAACFDANGGLYEPLLGPEDAIVSDSLNHASIIDGVRRCKARLYRYANNNMADLEIKLKTAREAGARHVMIATDGVFSMDGQIANLPEITRLGRDYDAVVMVDDCHATGFMGPRGAGTPDHFGVEVDILTGTLGKALGGALGGHIVGPQPGIDLLRQRARPYLFSNALPPLIVAAGLEAIRLMESGQALRERLFENAAYWRKGLNDLGFALPEGEHPIIPVMLGEASLAQKMAELLFDEGVFVAGFFYPVVSHGQARIRTQMNAALTREQLDLALAAFAKVGRELGVIQ